MILQRPRHQMAGRLLKLPGVQLMDRVSFRLLLLLLLLLLFLAFLPSALENAFSEAHSSWSSSPRRWLRPSQAPWAQPDCQSCRRWLSTQGFNDPAWRADFEEESALSSRPDQASRAPIFDIAKNRPTTSSSSISSSSPISPLSPLLMRSITWPVSLAGS